jgi:hypothetical protein
MNREERKKKSREVNAPATNERDNVGQTKTKKPR